jgi:hypothetical protein
MPIPNIITREHIISAIQRIGSPENVPSINRPRSLALRYNNRNYPIKYVLCIAHEIATGRELSHREFTTHIGRDYILRLGGFTIIRIQD